MIRFIIGIALVSIACLFDFGLYGIGTTMRFIIGLVGSYILLSPLRFLTAGYFSLLFGFIIYTFSIRSGSLPIYQEYELNGILKSIVRVVSLFSMVIGYTALFNKTLEYSKITDENNRTIRKGTKRKVSKTI